MLKMNDWIKSMTCRGEMSMVIQMEKFPNPCRGDSKSDWIHRSTNELNWYINQLNFNFFQQSIQSLIASPIS